MKQVFGEHDFGVFFRNKLLVGISFLFRNKQGNMPLGKKLCQKQAFGGNKPFVEKQALNKVKTRFWGTSFF